MDLELLQGTKILITGATGLLGKSIINEILKYNDRFSQTPIEVIAVIRNKDKAFRCFGTNNQHISYIEGDIKTVDLSKTTADYIIHAASQTASKSFINEPINTIEVAIEGTRHILDYAKTIKVKKFIYLSTMEVYGTPQSDKKIKETHGTDLDTMSIRACYPESKRMCENLCVSYSAEFGIPFNILRLTQTFGPGQAYNVANEETYCSIYEMAQLVAKEVANESVRVKIKPEKTATFGYAPTLHMNLDTTKLKSLGWEPTIGLKEMYKKMIEYMKENKNDC